MINDGREYRAQQSGLLGNDADGNEAAVPRPGVNSLGMALRLAGITRFERI